MNRLDEIRVTGEGLQRRGRIAPEEMGDVVVLLIQRRKLAPRQCVFQVAPDSFNRIQLWAIGRQEHEAHVGWEGKPLSRMGPAVVQEQVIQALRAGLGEGIQEDLKALGVEIRQLQEEALAGGGLHGAIDREPLVAMLYRTHRLHPTGGEASAATRQEAKAAFILAKDPHWASIRRWDDRLKALPTGSLERWDRLRLFGCDWGAAL